MKMLKKIIIYFSGLSVLAFVCVWFCKSESCFVIHKYLLNFNLFSIFRGNKEFTIEILIDIALTSLFTAIGFIISYIETIRKRQEELKNFYITIKNKCFDRIFYQSNSYDDDIEEVSAILDYLIKCKENILDYRPILLTFKIKLFRLINKTKKSKEKKDVSLFSYIQEDKYALICSIFSDLYKYFLLLHIYQTSILESEKVILLYEKKVKELGNDTAWFQLLEKEKINLEAKKNRLVSRFPHNTKENKTFLNKKDLMAKFYSIDTSFPGDIYSEHFSEIMSLEDAIVEDNEVAYNIGDKEITYDYNFKI